MATTKRWDGRTRTPRNDGKTLAWARAGLAAAVLGGIAWSGVGRAEELPVQTLPARPKPFAYGILIGANRGGAGQAPLHFAGEDARKMAAVLKEVGRYGPGEMRVLLDPAAGDVLSALDGIAQRLREHERKNEQAVLVFYYSGHAKANAIHLGGEQIEITTLRDRLRSLPSTLTLVVLDACQSGAFQRTKGATPAADFSTNSVARLTTKGIAVMASSNGQELSQESDELRGSYFTHHLVVALRGAGDLDRDGKVTLDEAYRYAYRRTLAATERTAVGAQHVTLETDLSGQGDVALTFPAEARSQLELPADLEGRVVVQQRTNGAVIAEIHKVKGAAVRLALASGDYDATVRVGKTVTTCAPSLTDERVTALDLGRCSVVNEVAFTKGPDETPSEPDQPRPPPATPAARLELARWFIELGLGATQSIDDAYSRRLRNFEYEGENELSARLSGVLGRSFDEHFAVGVEALRLPSATFYRSPDQVEMGGFGLAGIGRASLPISLGGHGRFELYTQLRLGVASAYETISAKGNHSDEWHQGILLGGDAGMVIYGRNLGGFFSGGYDFAPALENKLSDRRDFGGGHFLLGLRIQAR